MTEITVRFNLTFSRRVIATASAAAMMFCAVPELNSESVTLSTYYPAPSGVYTNMITTGHTYLARDPATPVAGVTSFVGINTTALPVDGSGAYLPNVKLKVVGDVQMAHVTFPGVGGNSGVAASYYGIYQEAGVWAAPFPDLRVQYHTGISYDAYYGYGGHRFFTGFDNTGNPTGAGASLPAGSVKPMLTVNDAVRLTGGPIVYQGPACTDVTYAYPSAGGGVVNLCPGQYVTLIDGVYSTKSIIPVQFIPQTFNRPEINARCCPCPVGGCSGM